MDEFLPETDLGQVGYTSPRKENPGSVGSDEFKDRLVAEAALAHADDVSCSGFVVGPQRQACCQGQDADEKEGRKV